MFPFEGFLASDERPIFRKITDGQRIYENYISEDFFPVILIFAI